MARVATSRGEWKLAREHLERASKRSRKDTAAKASAWHELATIYLNEGDYPAARQKFDKALQMRQAIGDPVGEAAMFFQLGILAHQMGRSQCGCSTDRDLLSD